MDAASAAPELLDLINGCWTTQALCAGVELGVFDALQPAPATAAELARRLGTDSNATARLLRALTTLGVCSASDDGTHCLTDLGRLLCADHPDNFQGWALLAGRPLWEPWKGLADSVRTGLPHHRRLGRTDRFRCLDTNDDEARIFQRAMVASTRAILPAATAAISRCLRTRVGVAGTVADVGAGHGELLAGVLDAMPDWNGVAFDLPYARPFAEATFSERNLGERARFEAGSFFEVVPAANALLLKSVLHDWDDERASAILRSCRQALAADGVLAIVERPTPERPADCAEHRRLARADLNMLVGPGGRERSLQEFQDLLSGAGLRLVGQEPVAAGFRVLLGAR